MKPASTLSLFVAAIVTQYLRGCFSMYCAPNAQNVTMFKGKSVVLQFGQDGKCLRFKCKFYTRITLPTLDSFNIIRISTQASALLFLHRNPLNRNLHS